MKKRLSVTVDQEILEKVDGLAEAEGRSRSAQVEFLLRQSLGGNETMTRLMSDDVVRRAMMEAFSNPNVLGRMMALMNGRLPKQAFLDFMHGVEKVGEDVGRGLSQNAGSGPSASGKGKRTRGKRS